MQCDLWTNFVSAKEQSSRRYLFRSRHPRCSIRIGVLRNFTKFTRKHLCQSTFFYRPAILLKKRLWHKYFPVNFAKFLRTPFLTEHVWAIILFVVYLGYKMNIVPYWLYILGYNILPVGCLFLTIAKCIWYCKICQYLKILILVTFWYFSNIKNVI